MGTISATEKFLPPLASGMPCEDQKIKMKIEKSFSEEIISELEKQGFSAEIYNEPQVENDKIGITIKDCGFGCSFCANTKMSAKKWAETIAIQAKLWKKREEDEREFIEL